MYNHPELLCDLYAREKRDKSFENLHKHNLTSQNSVFVKLKAAQLVNRQAGFC
jgi:hypothetical protein